MNHYPRHIGDWMRDTAHLSEVEECIYSRCIDQYYSREAPLPADKAAVARLVRASTAQARKAVGVILDEFFKLEDDGWHQKRCDQELSVFMDGAEDREQKLANEKERVKRHRERRKQMFEALRAAGIIPDWNAKTDELERLCNAHVTRTGDDLQRVRTAVDTANQNQYPVPNNQEPIKDLKDTLAVTPTTATAICVVLRSEGIPQVNAQHPELLELIANGAEVGEFVEAARKAKDKNKGFAYALGIVKNARADAIAKAQAPRQMSATMRAIMTLESMKPGVTIDET
tara:strand:- start:998 stop:1855 length:858 start_codon:yes stop_codon:yes gene_type:complete